VKRLRAMLTKLDEYAARAHCDHGHACFELGEIELVAMHCAAGDRVSVGAGDATGEDLRAALDELEQLRADHGNEWAVQWWETRTKSILIGALAEADARSFKAEKGGRLLTRPRCNPSGEWREVTDA
jgi:hypothetical protein